MKQRDEVLGVKIVGGFTRGSDPLGRCLSSCGTIPPLWCRWGG
jgi:hypothetical protein